GGSNLQFAPARPPAHNWFVACRIGCELVPNTKGTHAQKRSLSEGVCTPGRRSSSRCAFRNYNRHAGCTSKTVGHIADTIPKIFSAGRNYFFDMVRTCFDMVRTWLDMFRTAFGSDSHLITMTCLDNNSVFTYLKP